MEIIDNTKFNNPNKTISKMMIVAVGTGIS